MRFHLCRVETSFQEHTEQVGYLVFSPDSTLLASSSWDGTVRLWVLSQLPRSLAVLDGMRGEQALADVAFSPDSTLLATGAEKGRVRIWTRDGQARSTLESGLADTRAVKFTPDGRYLAASFSAPDVVVWTSDGAEAAHLPGHDGGASDLAFSPDGSILATGDSAGILRLWDTASWRLLASVEGAPLETTLPPAPADAGATPPPSPTRSRWIGMLAWSPNSRRLALRGHSERGEVHVWDVPVSGGAAHLAGTIIAPGRTPTAIQFSPDGRLLLIGDQDTRRVPARERMSTVAVFDALTLQPVGTLPVPDDFAAALVFSPGGQTLAVGGAAGTVWLWAVGTRQLLASIPAHTDSWDYREGAPLYALSGLAWSPDGRWIATAGLDPTDPAHARFPEGEPGFAMKLWNAAPFAGA